MNWKHHLYWKSYHNHIRYAKSFVIALYICINTSLCLLEMFDLSFSNLTAVQMSFCLLFSLTTFQVSSWSWFSLFITEFCCLSVKVRSWHRKETRWTGKECGGSSWRVRWGQQVLHWWGRRGKLTIFIETWNMLSQTMRIRVQLLTSYRAT